MFEEIISQVPDFFWVIRLHPIFTFNPFDSVFRLPPICLSMEELRVSVPLPQPTQSRSLAPHHLLFME
jgi:hypothetical protein